MRNIIFTFIFATLTLILLSTAAYLFTANPSQLGNSTYAAIFFLLGAIIYGFITGNNISTIIKEESI